MTAIANEEQEPTRTEVDHELLLQMLRRLEGAVQSEAIAQMLDDLHEYLRVHFAAEEAPGGYFATVMFMAPRHVARIEALEREHGEILEWIAELRRGAHVSLEPAPPQLRDEVAELVATLRAHEAIEHSLLQDTFDSDIPDGD